MDDICVFNSNLGGTGGGEGNFIPLYCWFSLNNSEMVKAVTVTFCSIQKLFIRDICTKFGIPNFPQSPDIEQNLDGGVSYFLISGQFLRTPEPVMIMT